MEIQKWFRSSSSLEKVGASATDGNRAETMITNALNHQLVDHLKKTPEFLDEFTIIHDRREKRAILQGHLNEIMQQLERTKGEAYGVSRSVLTTSDATLRQTTLTNAIARANDQAIYGLSSLVQFVLSESERLDSQYSQTCNTAYTYTQTLLDCIISMNTLSHDPTIVTIIDAAKYIQNQIKEKYESRVILDNTIQLETDLTSSQQRRMKIFSELIKRNDYINNLQRIIQTQEAEILAKNAVITRLTEQVASLEGQVTELAETKTTLEEQTELNKQLVQDEISVDHQTVLTNSMQIIINTFMTVIANANPDFKPNIDACVNNLVNQANAYHRLSDATYNIELQRIAEREFLLLLNDRLLRDADTVCADGLRQQTKQNDCYRYKINRFFDKITLKFKEYDFNPIKMFLLNSECPADSDDDDDDINDDIEHDALALALSKQLSQWVEAKTFSDTKAKNLLACFDMYINGYKQVNTEAASPLLDGVFAAFMETILGYCYDQLEFDSALEESHNKGLNLRSEIEAIFSQKVREETTLVKYESASSLNVLEGTLGEIINGMNNSTTNFFNIRDKFKLTKISARQLNLWFGSRADMPRFARPVIKPSRGPGPSALPM